MKVGIIKSINITMAHQSDYDRANKDERHFKTDTHSMEIGGRKAAHGRDRDISTGEDEYDDEFNFNLEEL